MHSRFRKGVSGNPSGRKKGGRPLKSDLADELAAIVRVNENGRARTYTRQRLVMKQLVTRAAKGDNVATGKLIDLACRVFGIGPDDASDTAPLTSDDQEVLDAFVARQRKGSGR